MTKLTKRAVGWYQYWVGDRIKHLVKQGLSPKDAMRQAAKEWRKQKSWGHQPNPEVTENPKLDLKTLAILGAIGVGIYYLAKRE